MEHPLVIMDPSTWEVMGLGGGTLIRGETVVCFVQKNVFIGK